MIKPEELLSVSQKERSELFASDPILREILQHKNTILTSPIDNLYGEELSSIASRLAVLLINLGQAVTDAELLANASYIYRKWVKSGVVRKLTEEFDKSITLAKETADTELKNELEAGLKARYKADLMRSIYQDTERLISVLQSRLRVLHNEEVRSRGINV